MLEPNFPKGISIKNIKHTFIQKRSSLTKIVGTYIYYYINNGGVHAIWDAHRYIRTNNVLCILFISIKYIHVMSY